MKEVAAQTRFNPAFLDTFAWLNVKILLVIAIAAQSEFFTHTNSVGWPGQPQLRRQRRCRFRPAHPCFTADQAVNGQLTQVASFKQAFDLNGFFRWQSAILAIASV